MQSLINLILVNISKFLLSFNKNDWVDFPELDGPNIII
jgi:hypothetical protein